jgi:hypothetical protein
MTGEVKKTVVAENPAVETAKQQESGPEDGITTLTTGVRVRLKSVSSSLVAEVMGRVQDPEVPIFHDEEKDRDLPNPNDPGYLRALDDAETQRNQVATDAMLVFGVELVDPLPKNEDWIEELAFLGIEVDKSSKLATEFAYKKYIAVGTPDLPLVYGASSPVSATEVAQALESFPDNSEGDSTTGTPDS